MASRSGAATFSFGRMCGPGRETIPQESMIASVSVSVFIACSAFSTTPCTLLRSAVS